MEGKAVNVIMFNVRGLNLFNGQLKIEASFKTASKSVESLNSSSPLMSIRFALHALIKAY